MGCGGGKDTCSLTLLSSGCNRTSSFFIASMIHLRHQQQWVKVYTPPCLHNSIPPTTDCTPPTTDCTPPTTDCTPPTTDCTPPTTDHTPLKHLPNPYLEHPIIDVGVQVHKRAQVDYELGQTTHQLSITYYTHPHTLLSPSHPPLTLTPSSHPHTLLLPSHPPLTITPSAHPHTPSHPHTLLSPSHLPHYHTLTLTSTSPSPSPSQTHLLLEHTLKQIML